MTQQWIQQHDVLGRVGVELQNNIKGRIESVHYSITGSIQYGVVPKSNYFVKNPDVYSHDYQAVKMYPDRWFRKRLPVTNADPKYMLGQAVASRTSSKIYGYVNRISIYANGCIGYGITPFECEKIEVATTHFLFEPMIQEINIEEGIYEDAKDFTDIAAFQIVSPHYGLGLSKPRVKVKNDKAEESSPVRGGPSLRVERPL